MISDKLQAVPKVSAIITTHNRKSLVEKAIDSVLRQTYSNIELLVVDDASDDGTKEILSNRTKRDGFEYIYITKEESKGGNHARNVGINHSKGEYIAFLDDDDEWMPEKIEKQVAFFVSNSDYGAVSCLTKIECDLKDIIKEPLSHRIEGDIHQDIFKQIYCLTSSLMIRRDILDKCGLFDENIGFWQEYELSIRFAQITKAGIVPEYLMLYRIINNSNNQTSKLYEWREAVEYISDKHKDLITKLPNETYRKYQGFIAKDGMNRSSNIGDKESMNYYGLMMLKYDISVKYIMKWIIGEKGKKTIRRIKSHLLKNRC